MMTLPRFERVPILVDTNGLMMHLLVHEAGLQDHEGGKELLVPSECTFHGSS